MASSEQFLPMAAPSNLPFVGSVDLGDIRAWLWDPSFPACHPDYTVLYCVHILTLRLPAVRFNPEIHLCVVCGKPQADCIQAYVDQRGLACPVLLWHG